ncbi:MAG: four helix bundle protein [Acutalibacteraceae bacterium]
MQGFAWLFCFAEGNAVKKGCNIMTDSPLITKSKEFALQIIKVCNFVKQSKKETGLTNQLICSGTSVGANIRNKYS